MMLKIGVLVAGAEYPIVSVLVSNSFAEYEYVCVYIYIYTHPHISLSLSLSAYIY